MTNASEYRSEGLVMNTGQMLRMVGRLGAPAVLESALMSIVILTDTLMLAQLPGNETYLAATAIAGLLYWRLTNISGCTQIGAGAYVARRWGENDFARASTAATHAIVLGGIIGLVVGLGLLPLIPLVMPVFTDDPEVVRESTIYISIIVGALCARLGLLSLKAVMRAAGDTLTPLLMTIGTVGVNVFLNWVLIFGNLGFPELRTAGAAIASASAFALELAIGLVLLGRGLKPRVLMGQGAAAEAVIEGAEDVSAEWLPFTKKHRSPPRGMLKLRREGFRPWLKDVTPTILRVSRPALGEEIVISIGFVVFIGMIGALGTAVLAAHSVTVRIESLSFTVGIGAGFATSALVGQALGARQPELAKRLFSLNATTCIAVMSFMGLLFAAVPTFFLKFFDLEGETMVIGVMLMCIVGMAQPFMAATMVLMGGLKGAGDTRSPFLSQLVGVLVMRVGMGYVLAWPLGMGIAGIYWATALDWLARGTFLTLFVAGGRWKKIQV